MALEEVERRILKELSTGMRTAKRLHEATQVEGPVLVSALGKLTKEYLIEPTRIVHPKGNRESALVLYRLTPSGLKMLKSHPGDTSETPDSSMEEVLQEIDDLDMELLDTVSVSASRSKVEPETNVSHRKKGNFYWRLGLFLIVIGAIGFVGFSVLHDVFRIPIIGEAFDEFGKVNRLAVILGVMFQVFGIAFLFLSEVAQKTGSRYSEAQMY
ncbi:MAG: hypothetical protein ACE5IO_01355 [Thermoplasmata archaeon]